MKKVLLGILVGVSAISATAAVEAPVYFQSNFLDELSQGHSAPEGYVTYGVEGTIESAWARYFQNYTPQSAYSFLSWGSGTAAAFSPCGFTSGSTPILSDQWLITPEFKVNDDNFMFSFDIVQSGKAGTQNVSVYISEGGTAKEDFVKLKDITFNGNSSNIITNSQSFNIEGYKDKNVRIALQNHDNSAGIIGFYNLMACSYISRVINADDLEYIMISAGEDIKPLSFQYQISTPVNTKGFTAVLRTEKGFETTFTSTRNITSSRVSFYNVTFPEAIDMMGETEQNYTITITPNNEMFEPTIITGKIMVVESNYDANALIEEITGSWCGWCPLGISMMEYYKDKYNTSGKTKVIPMMLHDGDLMQASNDYLSPVMSRMGKYVDEVGYPMAMVNRATASSPTVVDVAGALEGKSYATLNILEAGPDADNPNMIRVRNASKAGFTSDDPVLSIAVVLIENDVHGTTRDWAQADYLYGRYSEADIKGSFGDEAWPYFEMFLNPDNLTVINGYYYVKPALMYYPDVVRGIAPSYYGQPLSGWVKHEVRTDDLLIEMPQTGVKKENCSVVAFLIGPNGNIVGSDILPYEDWAESLEGSGIKGAVSMNLNMVAMPVADGLGIKLNDTAMVCVYGIDGTLLFNGVMQPGENILSIAKGQAVIVKATSGANTQTAKVVL